MLVNKCDICGHEINSFGTSYRVKGLRVEEEHRYGFDVVWKKKDLCFDCRRNIIRAAKLLKAGMEVNEVFVREQSDQEVKMDKLYSHHVRTVRVHKEQFDAIEQKADTVIISCVEDGRCLVFDREDNKEPTNE